MELDKTKLSLKPIDANNIYDVSILYQLLYERKDWQSISHSFMPNIDAHIEFIKSNPYKIWYIIMYETELNFYTLGSLYVTHKNELGLFLFEKYQKLGYGTLVLKFFLEITNIPEIFVNINPNNEASIKFFTEKFKFKHIQNTYKYTKIVKISDA